MSPCVLCGAEGAHDRMCGLDVCPRCAEGHLEPGLERWGLKLEQRRWTETQGSGDNSRTVDCLEVVVHLAEPLVAAAHFRKEQGWDRLMAWFGNEEPQVGDDLFDRFVFVEDPKGPQLELLLADEGIQGAVMELVSTGGVRLSGDWVRARRASSVSYPSFEETAVPLVLFAVHCTTHAEMRG